MRAYLRTSGRTGLSMPFWLAAPFMVCWGALVILYLMGYVVVFAAHSLWLGGQWVWARYRPPAP